MGGDIAHTHAHAHTRKYARTHAHAHTHAQAHGSDLQENTSGQRGGGVYRGERGGGEGYRISSQGLFLSDPSDPRGSLKEYMGSL